MKMLKVQELNFSEWIVRTYDENGNICTTHEKIRMYSERNSFNNEDTDRHILMMSIEKNDIKGNEIYIKDILRHKDGGIYLVTLIESCPVFMKIKESNGKVLNLPMYVPIYMMKSEDLFEVIGNDIENNYLLK